MSQIPNESDSDRDGAAGSENRRDGVSRRQVLTGAAGAALAAITGTERAQAQYTGIMPGGGTVPFRLPLGALNYLDRNQYAHNMEVVSFIEGARTAGGEPLMAMWSRGDQRLLPGRRGWVDVSDPVNPTTVEASSRISGCVAYNTELRRWLMIETAREPSTRPNPELPRVEEDYPERRRRALGYDGLRGIRVYDITDPTSPDLLDEFSTGDTGTGTHMNFYDGGRYAYLDASFNGQLRMDDRRRTAGAAIMVVDLSDPMNVREVSRWHHPGQMRGEEEEYRKLIWAGTGAARTSVHGGPVVPQRIENGGRYGYFGYGHWGFFVFDFSDIRNPRPVGQTSWEFETMGGIPYHSVYPVHATNRTPQLRDIIVTLPEALWGDCREPYKPAKIIDVSEPSDPRVVGLFPRPNPPEEAPYTDFCLSRGRFGTHNIQCWVAPGTSRPEIVVFTHFNAGIRVYDISDPTAPQEVAYFIPPRGGQLEDYDSYRRGDSETVFVEWDRNLIWLGTNEGSYCLSTPALGRPVLERQPIENWTQPHLNRGWDS